VIVFILILCYNISKIKNIGGMNNMTKDKNPIIFDNVKKDLEDYNNFKVTDEQLKSISTDSNERKSTQKETNIPIDSNKIKEIAKN